jgi:hypothetical protein
MFAKEPDAFSVWLSQISSFFSKNGREKERKKNASVTGVLQRECDGFSGTFFIALALVSEGVGTVRTPLRPASYCA